MSWIEWGVLAAGLAIGYGVVTMLMGERRARRGRGPATPLAPADAVTPEGGGRGETPPKAGHPNDPGDRNDRTRP